MKVRNSIALVLLIFTLAACGDTGTPTPAAGGQRTAVSAPTKGGSTSGGVATSSIRGPVFTFMPKQGQKGSELHLSGANFTPGSIVAIRIGVPDPVGEPLATASVNEEGKWSAAFIMPGTLPSGQAITTGTVNVVVMDENNQVIGSQPFRYSQSK